jgi:hypothetical protein
MQMGGNVQNARSRENRMMEDLEKQGSSLFNTLFDNSGVDTHLKKDSRGVVTGVEGGILGSLDITKKEDNMGKNVFYYLQNVYKELTYIRKYGTGIGGPSAYRSGNVNVEDRFGKRHAEARRISLDEASDITNTAKKTHSQSRREQELKEDDRYLSSEQRRRQRASGRNDSLGIIDYDKDQKDILTTAAIKFREVSEKIDRDEMKDAYDDMPWLYRMIDEEARSNRERNKDILERGVKHDDSFLNKLLKAGSLGDKYAVIRDGLDIALSIQVFTF